MVRIESLLLHLLRGALQPACLAGVDLHDGALRLRVCIAAHPNTESSNTLELSRELSGGDVIWVQADHEDSNGWPATASDGATSTNHSIFPASRSPPTTSANTSDRSGRIEDRHRHHASTDLASGMAGTAVVLCAIEPLPAATWYTFLRWCETLLTLECSV